MKCPRCTNSLNQKMYENVEIDVCSSCGGTWLDEGELTQIIQTEDEEFTTTMVHETIKGSSKGVPEDEQETKLLCPKCDEEMTSSNYNYSSGIIIDTCREGHGVWLDKNELEKVQINGEHWANQAKKHEQEWSSLSRNTRKKAMKDMDDSERSARGNFILGRLFNKLLGQ